MPFFKEELLEPLARYFRFNSGLKHIDRSKSVAIADLGCGPKLRFYYFSKNQGIKIAQYFGVDPLLTKNFVNRFKKHKQIKIVNKALIKKIALKDGAVGYVVGFAFFEHIDHPKEILAEAYRILKPGGKIILTVPSPRAKLILEFLSFKLKIISRREIEEHKQYFDKESLIKILPKKVKKAKISHEYFEFGLNNLLVITK